MIEQMKKSATCWLIISFTALLSTSSSAIEPPFEHPRSFAFLEQRGGVRIAPIYRKHNRWVLPVECNVSGIQATTQQPTVIHAGLAWSRNITRIDGDRILLTVVTATQGTQAPSAICGDAPLIRLYEERYEVFYLDPDGTTHPLGSVTTGAC